MPLKTYKLDASALSRSGCPERYYKTVVEGVTELEEYNDTAYGTAVHKFISRLYESNLDISAAMRAASKSFNSKKWTIRDKKGHLTENHLIATCCAFYDEFLSKDNFDLLVNPSAKCYECAGTCVRDEAKCFVCDGKGTISCPLVEYQFQIPYYKDDEVEILIVGTMDKIGKIKNGVYCVGDYKTTSMWDVKKYFKSFRLSPQLKLYVWALRKLSALYPDGPLGILRDKPIGAFIDGIFLKSAKDTEFHRSEIFQFQDWEMEEFERFLEHKVKQLVCMIKNPDYVIPMGKIEGTCKNEFVPCYLTEACAAVDDYTKQAILKNNFRHKPYDPFNFHNE